MSKEETIEELNKAIDTINNYCKSIDDCTKCLIYNSGNCYAMYLKRIPNYFLKSSEIDYLKKIIEPFSERVSSITKSGNILNISITGRSDINIPIFNNMFEGLDEVSVYTPEQLKLRKERES